MKAYLFPGQGSQFKGMGKGLFDAYPEMANTADKILGYSIRELCLDDKQNRLNQTQYTQPALFVVNAMSYRQKLKETGKAPDFVAGHSLGEYNALEAAQAFSFANGLKMVKKRGELMSKAPKGAMAAVIGSTEDEIKDILIQNNLIGIDIANYNSPSQTVLSGLEEDIRKAQTLFEKAKIQNIILNTSGAFHSRYMAPAKDKFQNYLSRFNFSKLRIPVISNVHARPYHQKDILVNLADQISHSVKWSESVCYLMEQGDVEFEELGVGSILTRIVQTICSQSTPPTTKEKWEYAKNHAAADEEIVPLEIVALPKAEATDTCLAAPSIKKSDSADWDRVIATPHEKVAYWNRTYPIGTNVSIKNFEIQLKTRTKALLLFGNRAAVYMQGYSGYFALDEVAPVQEVS